MNTRYDLNMEVPPREAVRLLYISKSRFGGDWRSVPHTHACTEMFYCVSGRGQFNIEGKLFDVAPDDLIIRMMPNTPVALGAGMIQYCCDDVGPAQLQEWLAAMQPAGRLDEVPETLIDAASAVSGCGPAWVYQFIEALADGGVAAGLPRAKAQEYAAQMVLGSARMVLESGNHPGALKDAVCSPGGSTIQGVRLLEERAFRGAVTDAVLAAYEKTKELGK